MHVDSVITPHNILLRSCWPGRVMKKKKKTLEDVAEVPAQDISKGVHYPSGHATNEYLLHAAGFPLVECMDLRTKRWN